MAARWFGQSVFYFIDSSGLSADTQFIFDLDLSSFGTEPGRTVVRTLWGWAAESEIVDNSSGVDRVPFPCSVKFSFLPPPDGDPAGNPQDPGGDALWRETLAWQRNYWTDGTLFGTKFTAYSGPYRSSQGQRKIPVGTGSLFQMGIGFNDDVSPDSPTNWLPITARGYMQVAYLIDSIFGF